MFQVVPAQGSIAGRVSPRLQQLGQLQRAGCGYSDRHHQSLGWKPGSPVDVQTDPLGNYIFQNLAAGTYTLTETQPTTPANQSGKGQSGTGGGNAGTNNVISNINITAIQAATGYTFAEVPILTTGGFVFEDSNGNGVKDGGEPGIQGVTVTLSGSSVVTAPSLPARRQPASMAVTRSTA